MPGPGCLLWENARQKGRLPGRRGPRLQGSRVDTGPGIVPAETPDTAVRRLAPPPPTRSHSGSPPAPGTAPWGLLGPRVAGAVGLRRAAPASAARGRRRSPMTQQQ